MCPSNVERRSPVARRNSPITLPEIARQLRKLLRPKYHQGHDEDDNQVWDAEHEGLNINRKGLALRRPLQCRF